MNVPDVDQGLVQASLAGDADAYGELVRRHQDRLYPTLLRLTGSAEDALDLLQDTFLRAYQNLDRFLGESSFYTWIYRIAVNHALSKRRRWRVGPRFRPFPETGRGETLLGTDRDDPSIPLERADLERQVQNALNRLSEEFRVVVILKDLEGLKYEQIADVLGIPIGTVRSRLHRARQDLRVLLRETTESTEEPATVGARSMDG